MNVLLIAEREVFTRAAIQEFLPEHDVTVVSDKNELAGIEIERFAIALADHDLASAKGTELIKHIRAIPSAIPIIAISGDHEGNASLLIAGANDVLPKAMFRDIAAKIREVIERL